MSRTVLLEFPVSQYARHRPLISGIRWVSELIEMAVGTDCFVEHAQFPEAKRRIIADASELARRRPDIIIGSWCGKRFRPEHVRARRLGRYSGGVEQ